MPSSVGGFETFVGSRFEWFHRPVACSLAVASLTHILKRGIAFRATRAYHNSLILGRLPAVVAT